jgi:hypothetical protein
VVLMEVSLSFFYHKFATASHTAILLRNLSPLCVCVCVCVCVRVRARARACVCVCVRARARARESERESACACGCVRACACHLGFTLVLDIFCWIVLGLSSGMKDFSDKCNK